MKKIFPLILALIIVGCGAFYGGMLYAKSKNSARNNPSTVSSGQSNRFMRDSAANFSNLSPEERQAQFGQMGGARMVRDGAGGPASGEIISKDDNSITVKLRDGGSKIIFYSSGTEISKFASGSAADLEVGKNISANGKTNPDGSITADSIQIRPAAPAPKSAE